MNKMEKITEKMGEYICDSICRHTADRGLGQEQLDDICAECEMGGYICHVLNEYERVKEKGREQTTSWPDRIMRRFLEVN